MEKYAPKELRCESGLRHLLLLPGFIALLPSDLTMSRNHGQSQWTSNIGDEDFDFGAPPLLLPVCGLDGVGGPSAKVDDARGEKLQDGQGGRVPRGDAEDMLHLHHVRYIK